ncbi:Phosphoglucan phosphatase DSP4 chloroplastic [Artemisia annua]|uniref:Phosphoglucan phosphatase DSP4 chloroplastic n=1 Tax=Artemisia annua TaxID=35608 RepID=A0A2U1MW18_ARTAN|nr:Phosphoglucan phosphatase DSP4 chloroplastic [Artemisia annua]
MAKERWFSVLTYQDHLEHKTSPSVVGDLAKITDGLKASFSTCVVSTINPWYENRRPELIAAFLDEVVEDPRVKIRTLDWNSIIHVFCKVRLLEEWFSFRMNKIPLQYDEKHISWILQSDLPEGRYEYKYIDYGKWMINTNELVTPVNKDGYINNYVQVPFNLIILYAYQHMLQRHRLCALIAHAGDGNFHTTIFFDQAEEGQIRYSIIKKEDLEEPRK